MGADRRRNRRNRARRRVGGFRRGHRGQERRGTGRSRHVRQFRRRRGQRRQAGGRQRPDAQGARRRAEQGVYLGRPARRTPGRRGPEKRVPDRFGRHAAYRGRPDRKPRHHPKPGRRGRRAGAGDQGGGVGRAGGRRGRRAGRGNFRTDGTAAGGGRQRAFVHRRRTPPRAGSQLGQPGQPGAGAGRHAGRDRRPVRRARHGLAGRRVRRVGANHRNRRGAAPGQGSDGARRAAGDDAGRQAGPGRPGPPRCGRGAVEHGDGERVRPPRRHGRVVRQCGRRPAVRRQCRHRCARGGAQRRPLAVQPGHRAWRRVVLQRRAGGGARKLRRDGRRGAGKPRQPEGRRRPHAAGGTDRQPWRGGRRPRRRIAIAATAQFGPGRRRPRHPHRRRPRAAQSGQARCAQRYRAGGGRLRQYGLDPCRWQCHACAGAGHGPRPRDRHPRYPARRARRFARQGQVVARQHRNRRPGQPGRANAGGYRQQAGHRRRREPQAGLGVRGAEQRSRRLVVGGGGYGAAGAPNHQRQGGVDRVRGRHAAGGAGHAHQRSGQRAGGRRSASGCRAYREPGDADRPCTARRREYGGRRWLWFLARPRVSGLSVALRERGGGGGAVLRRGAAGGAIAHRERRRFVREPGAGAGAQGASAQRRHDPGRRACLHRRRCGEPFPVAGSVPGGLFAHAAGGRDRTESDR
ncbi:Uncharacterised protein [Bordetella pertussis]|nr:Uncharacterised protein [Bordetella pertussis]CFM15627.1 Uncharacterised protein [Bordetella pertussis]CFM35160.1 Uncharacterised protein [Bordetella pertussis]CFM73171.1 Uncharacterised protein [Bordetella pertussis]CFM88687.1 Uncharacterised protein [Bordetella pertussis]